MLLCVFYVVKYLRIELTKRKYSIANRDKIEDVVKIILRATTETEYEVGLRYVYYVVDGKQVTLEEEIPASTHPVTTGAAPSSTLIPNQHGVQGPLTDAETARHMRRHHQGSLSRDGG